MTEIKLYCQQWKRAEGCEADEPCCWIKETERHIGRWQNRQMFNMFCMCDMVADNATMTMTENIPTDPDLKTRHKFKCRQCPEKCNIKSNHDFSNDDLCTKTGQHIAKWVKVE